MDRRTLSIQFVYWVTFAGFYVDFFKASYKLLDRYHNNLFIFSIWGIIFIVSIFGWVKLQEVLGEILNNGKNDD